MVVVAVDSPSLVLDHVLRDGKNGMSRVVGCCVFVVCCLFLFGPHCWWVMLLGFCFFWFCSYIFFLVDWPTHVQTFDLPLKWSCQIPKRNSGSDFPTFGLATTNT